MSLSGNDFLAVAGAIWTLGRPLDMRRIAREILRQSRLPRLNSLPLADVCAMMTPGLESAPAGDPHWTEACCLAELVMASNVVLLNE